MYYHLFAFSMRDSVFYHSKGENLAHVFGNAKQEVLCILLFKTDSTNSQVARVWILELNLSPTYMYYHMMHNCTVPVNMYITCIAEVYHLI